MNEFESKRKLQDEFTQVGSGINSNDIWCFKKWESLKKKSCWFNQEFEGGESDFTMGSNKMSLKIWALKKTKNGSWQRKFNLFGEEFL